MTALLSAETLLAYHEAETAQWKQWFLAHPEALAAKCDIARSETLGALLHHVFWVEEMYAARLTGGTFSDPTPPASPTVAGLFAIGEAASPLFHQFVANSSAESLAEIMTWQSRFYGEAKFSRGKVFLHAVLHSIRHWAQVPPILRAAGFDTVVKDANGKPWMHDFLFSGVME